jgi:excisionase family DNA binding protein
MPTNHTAGLTFGQAASRLGVGVLTIRSWVRTDRCPVIRDGRKVRIPADWVDELLAAGWRP